MCIRTLLTILSLLVATGKRSTFVIAAGATDGSILLLDELNARGRSGAVGVAEVEGEARAAVGLCVLVQTTGLARRVSWRGKRPLEARDPPHEPSYLPLLDAFVSNRGLPELRLQSRTRVALSPIADCVVSNTVLIKS